MMNKVLLMVTVIVLLSVPMTADARSIPGAPNEVLDPWFIQYVEQGTQTWYFIGTGGFTANQQGSLPGYHFDPGREPGDLGSLRTIVDDYDGLWNPDYHIKEIDIFFYAHLDGDGFIQVRFDWWDKEDIERPSPDPNDMGTPLPDGHSQWYTITATNPGAFRVAPDLVLPGEEPGAGVGWTPYSFHDIWDHQPRWVSIEILCGNTAGGIGGEALITGIDFEARCIPEPATMTVLAFGALALLLRRRKG